MPTYRAGPPGSAMVNQGSCPRVLQCEKCRRFLDCLVDCLPGFAHLGAEQVIDIFPNAKAAIDEHEAVCPNNG